MATRKRRNVRRAPVSQSLSDDAKQARMETWAVKLGMPKDVVQQLQDKYGSYAYTLMQKAMMGPTALVAACENKNVKEFNVKSREAVDYLVKKDLSSEQIAKAVGEKSSLKVDRQLADDKIAKAQKGAETGAADNVEKKKAEAQKKAIEEQKKLEAKADKKKDNQSDKEAQEKAAKEKAEKEVQAAKDRVTKVKADKDDEKSVVDKDNKTPIPLAPWQEKPAKIDSTQVTVQPIILKEGVHNELKSKAFVDGKPIKELKDSTEQSLFGVTHQREVGVSDNPVGVKGFDGKKHYYGAMQHNTDGVKNLSLYALVNDDKYGDYANKVFNTKAPGFKKDLEAFKDAVKQNGKDAYALGTKARARLLRHIKPDYLATFTKEGKNHPEQMLQLQRDGASSVTAAFYNLDGIAATLKAQGINPTDVRPSVWGMFISAGIARGNTNYVVKNSKTGKLTKCSAANLIKGKTLEQINSPEMIDRIAKAYPEAFRKSSKNEQAAVQWAKDHIDETCSVTTARELSMMIGDDELYENYLTKVAENQTANAQTKVASAENTQSSISSSLLRQSATKTM